MISIRPTLTRRVVAHTVMCFTVAGLLSLAFEGDDEQRTAPATTTAAPERITVPFSDPSRPGKLTVGLMNGNMHVKGYDGKEVIVQTRAEEEEEERRGKRDGDRSGLRRIPNTASGLTIEEEHNEMRISTSVNKDLVLDIQVPRNTSLKLNIVNGGDLVVENVDSEMEVSNINGDIRMTNVAGTGVVHSTNGELKASFSRVSGKPMSFTTFNGDVDVSLPADIKATVRLDSGQGEIYTDFPIDMQASTAQQTVQDDRSKGGKYRLKIEKAMIGKINGGGVDYTFKTFNGDIHLRRYQAGAAAPKQEQQ